MVSKALKNLTFSHNVLNVSQLEALYCNKIQQTAMHGEIWVQLRW